MTPLQLLTGPALGAALVTMLLVHIVLVIDRSRRPEPRTTTLATSRPVLTGVFLAAFWIGAVLLIIRLGVIS